MIHYELLDFATNYNGYFYFQYFYDFRGRIYCSSQISPTNNKAIRCIINYDHGHDYKNNNHQDTTAYSIVEQHLEAVKLIFQSKQLKNKELILLLFLFVELAKLTKVQLLADKECINVLEFLEHGYSLYLKAPEFADKIDAVYFLKIKHHISDIIENGDKYQPFIILKDSTASVLQHFCLTTKPTLSVLTKFNLNSGAQ